MSSVSGVMVRAGFARALIVKVAGVLDYSNAAIADAIDNYIHSERDRAILKRRLIDGLTYERLSEEFSMSVRQVKNIFYKAQDRLFSKMR